MGSSPPIFGIVMQLRSEAAALLARSSQLQVERDAALCLAAEFDRAMTSARQAARAAVGDMGDARRDDESIASQLADALARVSELERDSARVADCSLRMKHGRTQLHDYIDYLEDEVCELERRLAEREEGAGE